MFHDLEDMVVVELEVQLQRKWHLSVRGSYWKIKATVWCSVITRRHICVTSHTRRIMTKREAVD